MVLFFYALLFIITPASYLFAEVPHLKSSHKQYEESTIQNTDKEDLNLTNPTTKKKKITISENSLLKNKKEEKPLKAKPQYEPFRGEPNNSNYFWFLIVPSIVFCVLSLFSYKLWTKPSKDNERAKTDFDLAFWQSKSNERTKTSVMPLEVHNSNESNAYEKTISGLLYEGFKIEKGMLLNNFTIKGCESDHILITERVICVIEDKNHTGHIKANANFPWKVIYDDGKESVIKCGTLINPNKQVTRYSQQVKNVLESMGLHDYPVYGFVVFPDESVFSNEDEALNPYITISNNKDLIEGIRKKYYKNPLDIQRLMSEFKKHFYFPPVPGALN